MSDEISTIGVVGENNITPVYDPAGLWKIWSINEIYTGAIGTTGRYVPKVKDYVINPESFETWIVDHISPVTLIPELRIIRPANMSLSFSETDVLFGVGPGTQADTYRVYIDKSVTPYIMNVDRRLKVAGSMCSFVKIFKGSVLGSDGLVISRLYDASGNFLTDTIPLELAAMDSHDNYSIKVVPTCYTNEELTDGEIVTAVLYSDDGHVVSKRQLMVENTSFIRALNASHKYISHISLECPFLSPTNEAMIEFPLNVPVNALNLMGVVHYSDGTKLRLPVDGTKFRMYGLDQFVSTIVGQKIKLVLAYALESNESVYGAVSSDGKYVTEPYFLNVVETNNAYTVKVFGYPVWVNQDTGYRMRWFMFNLDRNLYFDVTNYVEFAENTGTFDPKGYGYMQRKAITLNLREVSGSFKPYIHTQLTDIVLNRVPDGRLTPWTMSHESIDERPAYGNGLLALRQLPAKNIISLKSDHVTLDQWLEAVYRQTYPLVDRMKESAAPTPTHFELQYNGLKTVFPITDWDKPITTTVDLELYSTIFIRFFKRTASDDIQLSMAAMLVTD